MSNSYNRMMHSNAQLNAEAKASAWRGDHEDVLQWISTSTSSFAQSLAGQYADRDTLSPSQVATVRKIIQRNPS